MMFDEKKYREILMQRCQGDPSWSTDRLESQCYQDACRLLANDGNFKPKTIIDALNAQNIAVAQEQEVLDRIKRACESD